LKKKNQASHMAKLIEFFSMNPHKKKSFAQFLKKKNSHPFHPSKTNKS